MTYIQDAVEAMTKALPDQPEELLRLYALLALTAGVDTTWEDVHDAWALWRDKTRSDHPSIVPFNELEYEVQELDLPYQKAIVKVARELRHG